MLIHGAATVNARHTAHARAFADAPQRASILRRVMLSTLIGPLLVFLAHASGFAWIADRTPARQRALRPLAPLVAITAIAGAVATGFVLSSALHRDVRGQVTARLDVPIKAGRATLLRVRESDGSTIDVSVPRALWMRCGWITDEQRMAPPQ